MQRQNGRRARSRVNVLPGQLAWCSVRTQILARRSCRATQSQGLVMLSIRWNAPRRTFDAYSWHLEQIVPGVYEWQSVPTTFPLNARLRTDVPSSSITFDHAPCVDSELDEDQVNSIVLVGSLQRHRHTTLRVQFTQSPSSSAHDPQSPLAILTQYNAQPSHHNIPQHASPTIRPKPLLPAPPANIQRHPLSFRQFARKYTAFPPAHAKSGLGPFGNTMVCFSERRRSTPTLLHALEVEF